MQANQTVISTLEAQLHHFKDKLKPEDQKALREYIEGIKTQKGELKHLSKNQLVEVCLRMMEIAKEQAKMLDYQKMEIAELTKK